MANRTVKHIKVKGKGKAKAKASATGNRNTINITIGSKGGGKARRRPRATQQPIVINTAVTAGPAPVPLSDQYISRGLASPPQPFNPGNNPMPYKPTSQVVTSDLTDASSTPSSFGATTTNRQNALENTSEQLTNDFHEFSDQVRGTMPPSIATQVIDATAQEVMQSQAMMMNNFLGLQQARNNQQAAYNQGAQDVSMDTSQQHSFNRAPPSQAGTSSMSTSPDDAPGAGAIGIAADSGDYGYTSPLANLVPNRVAGNPLLEPLQEAFVEGDQSPAEPTTSTAVSSTAPLALAARAPAVEPVAASTPKASNLSRTASLPVTQSAPIPEDLKRSESTGSSSAAATDNSAPNNAANASSSQPSSIRTPSLFVRTANRYGSMYTDSPSASSVGDSDPRERERSRVTATLGRRSVPEVVAHINLFGEVPPVMENDEPTPSQLADTEVQASESVADTEAAVSQPPAAIDDAMFLPSRGRGRISNSEWAQMSEGQQQYYISQRREREERKSRKAESSLSNDSVAPRRKKK